MKYFWCLVLIILNCNASNILYIDNNRIFKCKNKLVYIDLKNSKINKNIPLVDCDLNQIKCKDFNIDWFYTKCKKEIK